MAIGAAIMEMIISLTTRNKLVRPRAVVTFSARRLLLNIPSQNRLRDPKCIPAAGPDPP